MGEIADYNIEQGILALALHEVGECGQIGICPYCEAEVASGGERLKHVEET